MAASDNNLMQVSQIGTTTKTATGSQVTFNTKYPFAKLDKTNLVSFQNISIQFYNEPPAPSGTYPDIGPTTTLVYQFVHGYTYVPSTWFLMQVTPSSTVSYPPVSYQQEGTNSFFLYLGPGSGASLTITADATNVYFYVNKYYGGSFGLPNIIGYVLNIRAYVFVDDLSGK
jgi:hypothetical protein